MRRALLLAFLLLAFATLPAVAQRGARGGGGHAIGGGHPTGSGFRPMGGVGRGPGFGSRPMGFVPRGNGQFGNFGFHRPFNGGRFHHHFRNNDAFVWPWWGWGGWGWWDSDLSSYDYQQQQQADYNHQLALEGQLQYMQQQIAEMRHDQEVQRDYAASQAAPPAPPPASAPSASKSQDDPPPATTLVFRDGKRLEAQNYAIVGDTVWLMASNGHMQKIPLSELDRDATLKSNEDRGVDFRVPRQ